MSLRVSTRIVCKFVTTITATLIKTKIWESLHSQLTEIFFGRLTAAVP